MLYRSLGRTGVQVSALSLGSMLGGATPATEAALLIDMALDRGVNSLDTANVYGRGASEEAAGAALRRSGRRDRVVLASKVHARMDDDDPNAAGNSRRHIIEQCHASLKRLGVDHLDVYYVHRPSTEVPIDETLRALTDLVRAGSVRYIGAAASPPGNTSKGCGPRRSTVLTASWPSSRPTACSTVASSASCCRWRRATAPASRSGRRWPAAC